MTCKDGEVVIGNWCSADLEENASFITKSFSAHCGPCSALQRSPFFEDLLVSVGDWTFNIFKDGEDVSPRVPILTEADAHLDLPILLLAFDSWAMESDSPRCAAHG
jgi:hypothetical protein